MNGPTTASPEYAEVQYTCLDLRRDKLADPKRLPHAAHEHLRHCELCRAFARRIDSQEARVAELLAIPVPEGLAERVILHAKHRSRPAWRAWALAASVVLALSLGVHQTMEQGGQDMNLAALAIDHVIHEPESFTQVQAVDADKLHTVLAGFGGELQQSLGRVRYLQTCPVPGGTGWHMVLDTEYGMVTLILMPGQNKDQGELLAVRDGLMARARPGGNGYYAVVAESEQSLDMMEERLRTRIRWAT